MLSCLVIRVTWHSSDHQVLIDHVDRHLQKVIRLQFRKLRPRILPQVVSLSIVTIAATVLTLRKWVIRRWLFARTRGRLVAQSRHLRLTLGLIPDYILLVLLIHLLKHPDSGHSTISPECLVVLEPVVPAAFPLPFLAASRRCVLPRRQFYRRATLALVITLVHYFKWIFTHLIFICRLLF